MANSCSCKKCSRSHLIEAKEDLQKLIDFAGVDLANRFIAIKHRLKGQEKDLYYWIKTKTIDELEQTVVDYENTKSNSKVKKDITANGAELVAESAEWKVYFITTYEAARHFGRDTKWCISGINNWGDVYWKQYKRKGGDIYFFIAKNQYNARGTDSKFALVVYPIHNEYEAFDQQDNQIELKDIPNIDTITIPGVIFNKLKNRPGNRIVCDGCLDWFREVEITTVEDLYYCPDCLDEYAMDCSSCDTWRQYSSMKRINGEYICTSCLAKQSEDEDTFVYEDDEDTFFYSEDFKVYETLWD